MGIINEGVHGCSEVEKYIEPKQQKVKEKVEQWRDQKLGFMTHFGLFTQFGMVESWALSDEIAQDRWSQEGIDWEDDIELFKQQYWDLKNSFNPGRLDPARFANAIASFGFKYVLIPTKHHDGFCLWDTDTTDYKSTDKSCPFSTNQHSDIFGALTSQFQKHGLMTGAYFSKADWHTEYYWPDDYKRSGNVNRNVGYDVTEKPELWNKFCEFTETQMLEIVTNYAPIDIMWLDGGQVAVSNNQDIKLGKIAEKMRQINPGLLICDRTCGGEFENYITPEQSIPKDYISVPWESCITLGGPFAYSYEDNYKTAEQVAEIFVEVMCKGGNLALNTAPQPDGRLPQEALMIMTEFGDWVAENEKAIFATRPVAPYYQNGDGLVQDSDGNKYLYIRGGQKKKTVPKFLYTKFEYDFSTATYKNKDVKVEKIGAKYKITMPDMEIDRKAPLYYVFKIEE